MPHFNNGAVEIAYLDESGGNASAEPIVLVHGFASTKEVNWVAPSWVGTLRRAGRLHHLKIGAAHARRRVLAMADETTVTVVALDTGRMPPPPVSTGMAVAPASHASTAPTAPTPGSYAAGLQQASYAQQTPSPDEWRRWETPEVVRFRKKLAPYLFVNGVFVFLDLVAGVDLLWITVGWSIFLAFRYSRLWSDGYDWRDVFRQPRDRDLIDVVEDFVVYARSMFNRDKRREMREQRRSRLAKPSGYGGGVVPQLAPVGMDDVARAAGNFGDRIHRADRDRNEILSLLERMPSSERQRIPDVGRSASALAERVRNLALALGDIDRSAAAGGSEALEAEISRLESAANPLDESGSDERVRRLAFLKRQRRAIAEVSAKRGAIAAKLETCLVALQNIKLDLIRLNAGAQTPQHITSLAMDALNLADSVDTALYVADEMRNTGTKQARPSAAR